MHRTRTAFLALLLAVAPGAAAEEEPQPQDQPTPAAADRSPPPVVRQVGEVTITTTRSERNILETPGNITVLEREDIERSGARDVPDLLRREAGLFVTNTTNNPAGYTVEARGFNNGGGNGSRLLVLVDGRRINEPDSSRADWSFVHMDDVERIEVTRGPASAVWGDNAEAGVVHITTRRGHGRPRVEVRGRTGTYDTDAGSLFAGGSHGPLTASVFLEGFKSDGFRERSRFRSKHRELDLELELGERALVSVKGGYTDQIRQRPGSLSAAERAENRRQARPPEQAQDFSRVRVRFAEGRIELSPTDHVRAEVLAWHRRRNDDSTNEVFFPGFFRDRETEVDGITGKLVIDHPLAGYEHRLVLGTDVFTEEVDDDFVFGAPPVTEQRSRRNLWGVFIQDELWLRKDLILSLGVRRDQSKREGRIRGTDTEFRVRQSAWSPKAGLTWRVTPWASLYASWARGFRIPNLDEAFGAFGFSPELDPEKSETYEVGIKIRRERVSVNLTGYHTKVEDEIFFDPFAPNPVSPFPGRNANLQRTRHRGVELWSSLRPVEWLEIYGSYTFDESKVTRDTLTDLEGFRFPITPRHRGAGGVKLILPWDVEAGVDALWVGSRFVANDIDERAEKLPKHARYDVWASWAPQLTEHVGLRLHGAIRNVNNRRFDEFAGRAADDPTVVRFSPANDRHYEVGLRMEIRR